MGPEGPSFPPIFDARVCDPGRAALEVAAEAAAAGEAEAAALVWSPRPDRAEAALTLAPEEPLEEALNAALIVWLGLADAIGALAPPALGVYLAPPGGLALNGAIAGGVSLAAPVRAFSARPDWLVAGVEVALIRESAAREPGEEAGLTALHEEGCGDLDALGILEAFARHALVWFNRWEADGANPIRATAASRLIEGASAADLAPERLSELLAGGARS